MVTGEFKQIFREKQSGFTYLAILIVIAIFGVMLASTGINWSHASQREKEQELLFVGNQFRRAIALYYEKSPGAVKQYPRTLNDLLKDERQFGIQRYLRKIYIDPMTRNAEWGIVAAPDGGVKGVHSLSDVTPLKSANFAYADLAFEGKTSYTDWVFDYSPQIIIQNQAKK
ncbi:MAG: type II secretion system pseudopilin PulG [Betaproteobacteria bacterium RBG_16_56_24]|nr:MAG: type II secretion system pseudopilin PulG [Betaproteobacteria bacterium RBG_16_56_24]